MKSVQEIINECLYKQTVLIIQNVYETSENKELGLEDLLEKLTIKWDESVSAAGAVTAGAQAPRAKKSKVPETGRCLAIKKDKAQCNGKQQSKGKNPSLCSLHNTRGANYGIMSDTETSTQEAPTQGPSVPKDKASGCVYVFTRGALKGKVCGNACIARSECCKTHYKKNEELVQEFSVKDDVDFEFESEDIEENSSDEEGERLF